MIVLELLIKFELRVAKLAISCHCIETDDDLTDIKQNGSCNWRHFQMFYFRPIRETGLKAWLALKSQKTSAQ